MKITGLEVDGYGVWSGLKLQGLADGLNVLYGPNEAGKTTLLQFVRSILYGFTAERRRYLPPIRGGRPGGAVEVACPNGRFHLDRHHDEHDPNRPEQFTLTADDGARQGGHLLQVLLSEVDEAIYNNVFAVGLREVQELGTLSDTQAAELLYSLTAGLDRVSLVEVMRELETSRRRILAVDGGSCQVVQLLEQRDKLRSEIEELGKLTRQYGRLAGEQDQLQREVARLEEESRRVEQQARVIELAIELRGRWDRRADLDEQLAALGPLDEIPEGAVDRLDALAERVQRHRHEAEPLQQQRRHLRTEVSRLTVNETLWRQSARIEALGHQESWITTLESQAAELQSEIVSLETELDGERDRLGLGDHTTLDALTAVSARSLHALRPAARAAKQCRQELLDAQAEVAAAEESAQTHARQVEAALSARGQTNLAEAVDAAGNLVSLLRRRLQVDQRLDDMIDCQTDLEDRSRRLLGRQLLPAWVLAGFGVVFMLGLVLLMASLFMSASITGNLEWPVALLGLAGVVLAGVGKVMLERSNARQLDACQKQLSMLQAQIQQAGQERDALDEQLPGGGGAIAGRLEAAERELAALEELVPLDARQSAAGQEAHAAAGRVRRAEQELGLARRRWREALATAGLPKHLRPRQVRQLVRRCDHVDGLRRRLAHRREDLQQRHREIESLAGRIAQLAADTGVAVAADQPIEQLHQLAAALAEQEALMQRRAALRQQARQLRRKQAKHEQALGRLKQRRRQLLRLANVHDEQQLRQRAVQASRANVLRQQRDALAREIAAAVGKDQSEDAVGQQLEGDENGQLEARRDELLDRLETLDQQLKQRVENRGRLSEQMKTLAENRQVAVKQLELGTVDQRLQQSVRRWQVLALTGRILESIRTVYEQQRQPETLQEASGYLARLTRNRYIRVWTPLGEDVLRVDDAQGNALPVEALSRGTREQLFLSLRLALAASYARRGALLPLVLDDVLVNFDVDRAKAAAAVLRDFATAGHQVLVFTCHEHILKLFKSLKVPVNRLPDCDDAAGALITFEQPAAKKPDRRRASKPLPEVAAETQQELPPPQIIDEESDDAEPEEIQGQIVEVRPVNEEVIPAPDPSDTHHEPEEQIAQNEEDDEDEQAYDEEEYEEYFEEEPADADEIEDEGEEDEEEYEWDEGDIEQDDEDGQQDELEEDETLDEDDPAEAA